MVERVPMSKSGHSRLREELLRLQRVDRLDVIKAIETAREHGDLKENAEYHAAKERQSHIEGRIMELKDKLGRAEIIDCSSIKCERVIFGSVVTVEDLDSGQEIVYQLLGPEESDVKKGSISVFSPWGRAMLGKSIGDEFEVKTPSGTRMLEVINIQCAEVA